MKITYDLDLEDEDDARIGYADMAFSGLREVTASVLFVLQHFPSLRGPNLSVFRPNWD